MELKAKNLLILTGAGFSSPYMKYGKYFLNTAFLTQLITNDDLIEEFYVKMYSSNAPRFLLKVKEFNKKLLSAYQLKHLDLNVNFEHLLYQIELFINHKDSFTTNLIFETQSEFSLFEFDYEDYISLCEFLLDVISLFKPEQIDLVNLAQYFHSLYTNYTVKYYSLNYDSLIVDILNYIHANIKEISLMCDFNTGSVNSNWGTIDFKSTFNMPYVNGIDRKHSMFFLHGSVYYMPTVYGTVGINHFEERKLIPPLNRFVRKSVIKEHQTMIDTGGFNFNRSLITGFNKSIKITSEPYKTIFKKFNFDFAEADELLIIGYSFSDTHVNSILSGQRNLLKKITIVDYLPDDFSKEKYCDKLNLYTKAIQPFNDLTEVELWNVVFPLINKAMNQPLDDGNRYILDFNGTQKYILNSIKSVLPL